MAEASGYAVLPVTVSLKGVTGQLNKALVGPSEKAAKKSSGAIAKSMEAGVKKASKTVEAASKNQVAARDKATDAAEKTTLMEQRLAEVLEKHEAGSAKGIKAANDLEKARRDQARADGAAEKATADLEKAQGELDSATADASSGIAEQARAMEEAEDRSKKFSKALDGAALAIGGMALGATGALVKLGTDFDEAFRTIRTGTGATGEAFEGLKDSALSVMDTVPAMDGGMSQISETLADLNTRLGLTDEPLETMTGQMVALSNMGVDADINAVSQAMNGFGIEAKDMPAALDELFQVSQATGMSITDLANSAAKSGPQLRGFGFSMQDSAALVGQMDKAGIDADGTLNRLSRAMSTFAEEGRDAPEALKETITEIDSFIESGDEAAAMNLATDLFGTRGAAQFVDAVKSGTLSVDDFMAATGATTDTILGVSEETRTMGENFQLLKQKGETALQPIATKLVDALIPALETGAQKLEDFIGWVEENQGLVKGLATAAGIAAAAFVTWRGAVVAISTAQKIFAAATALSTGGIKAMNAAMKANVIGLIVTAIAGLVAGLVWFFTKTETGQKIWQGFMDVLSTAWTWLKDTFTPVFQWMGDVISSVWDGIKTGASWLWESVLQPIFGFIGTAWEVLSTGIQWYWENVIKRAWDTISTVISWLWNSVLQPIFGFIGTAWEALSTAIQWAWSSIIKPAWDAVSAAANWLWNSVLKPVFDFIKQGWDNLSNAIQAAWNNIIKPAWDAVGNALQALWDNVVSPVIDFIQDRWDDMGNGIRAIYDNVISPAFDALKTGLQKVRDFFGTVVDGIKGVWEKLRGILAKPINFMINTVYNNGILKAWNTIAGFIPGLNEADPLSGIPEHATGGAIRGPGSGTSDDVLMWGSNGEHMLTAAEVEALGGQQAVYTMRALIDDGKTFTVSADGGVYVSGTDQNDNGPLYPVLPAYKDGGEVRPAWEDKVARGHEWAKKQDGKPYIAGNAFPAGADCSGYMSALAGVILNGDDSAHWTTVAFPASQGQSVDAAGQPWVAGLGQGMSIGMSGGPASGGQNGHTAGTLSAAGKFGAVNVESGGANSRVKYGASDAAGADDGQFNSQYHLAIGADGDFEAAGGPSPEQKKGFIRDKVKGIFEEILQPIKDMFASAIGEPPPEWLGIPPKAMSSSKDKIVDFVFDRIEDLGNLVGKTYDAAKEMGSMVFEWGKSGVGWVGDKIGGLFRDQGGWIPNGLSVVRNETGRPEAVLNWEQVEAIKRMIDNFGVGYNPVAEAESILRGVTEGGSTPQRAVQGGTQVAQHVFAEEMGDKSALEHGTDAVFDFFGMGDSLTKKLLTTPANELAPLPDWYTKDQDGDTGSAATDTTTTDTAATEVSGAGVVMEDVSTPTSDDISVTAEMPDDFMANPATAVAGQSKPLVEDLDTIDPDRHKKPEGGPEGYVYGIVQSAQDHGLPASGAKIGVATALVEAGDPLQMWANNAVPESLNYPHDAVGSDHDSVGLFQQRDNGAWGTVAQRMDPYDSAGMFFDEMLRKFPNWADMDPGAVAQGVQVSAFPDRYATKMGRAETLVADAGLYDAGGTIPDGALAVNLSGSPEHVFTDGAMENFVDSSDSMKDAAEDLSHVADMSTPDVSAPVIAAPEIDAPSPEDGQSGTGEITLVINLDGQQILEKRVDTVEGRVEVNEKDIRKMKTARRAVDAGVRLLT